MRYIIHPKDPADAERLGGKAAALAAVQRAGMPVPAWFVLAPEAFYASVSEAERRALEATGSGDAVRALVERLTPGVEVGLQLAQALAVLCPNGERVAVRSSACDEDGDRHSFAGQLDSFLFVHPGEVATKAAAVEAGPYGVRVNAICPGLINTALHDALLERFNPEDPAAEKAAMTELVPLKRYGEPEEVATVVRFLASDESSYVTGAAWLIDAGFAAP